MPNIVVLPGISMYRIRRCDVQTDQVYIALRYGALTMPYFKLVGFEGFSLSFVIE